MEEAADAAEPGTHDAVARAGRRRRPRLGQQQLGQRLHRCVEADSLICVEDKLAESDLSVLRDLLRQGKLSLLEVVPRVKVRDVEGRELGDTHPFFNINTPQDLEKARTWLKET